MRQLPPDPDTEEEDGLLDYEDYDPPRFRRPRGRKIIDGMGCAGKQPQPWKNEPRTNPYTGHRTGKP